MSSRMYSSKFSLSSRKNTHKRRKRRRSNRSVSSEFIWENEGMSALLWYWSNYYKALLWQSKHKIAAWKSYAAGLEVEKAYLLEELSQVRRMFSANETPTSKQDDAFVTKSEPEEDESGEEEEFEIEVSEEMMNYFQESFRRKLEMKKLKEKKEEEVKQVELDIKDVKAAHELREKEMKLLYGEGSCMIIGMETAVQLSFDKYCDLKSPSYWPNIPLNL